MIVAACGCFITAAVLVGWAIAEESVASFGAAIILIAVGVFNVVNAVQRNHHRLTVKHNTVVSDLRSQGFKIEDRQVSAVDGVYLRQAEVDFEFGSCVLPFALQKIEDRWHVVSPAREGASEYIVLTPPDVARFGLGCPTK